MSKIQEPIPVYLINGFLESGKTQFLNFTLRQDYFHIEDTTLLLVCEEGIEEYDEDLLARENIVVEYIDQESDFTVAHLSELEDRYNPERIVIEFNGMWNCKDLQFPVTWELAQQITTVDATTFVNYFSNMKSIFIEMVRRSELVLFNRCDPTFDLAGFKRSIKAVNRNAEIVFEDENGDNLDEVLDEDLPYDVSADIIDIEERYYPIFYVDALDHKERYEGKKVRFLGMVYKQFGFKKSEFIPGRRVMTCCAEDVAFLGFLCRSPEGRNLVNRQWVIVTAEVKYEKRREYGGEGPVLYAISVEKGQRPAQDVLSFN